MGRENWGMGLAAIDAPGRPSEKQRDSYNAGLRDRDRRDRTWGLCGILNGAVRRTEATVLQLQFCCQRVETGSTHFQLKVFDDSILPFDMINVTSNYLPLKYKHLLPCLLCRDFKRSKIFSFIQRNAFERMNN